MKGGVFMPMDNDLIERVLHACDIVQVISSYIPVIKKGRNYVAICPFHDDKNPSLHISPEKQIFKCFVCGTGGNAITFVEKYEKISFMDAVRKVAELVGFHDERLAKKETVSAKDASLEPLYKALDDVASFYHYALKTEEGKTALDYLEHRDLDEKLQDEYRLGYALLDGKNTIKFLTSKGHSLKTIEMIGIGTHVGSGYMDRNFGRVIFPIMDANGRVVGFSARRLSDNKDEAKYVNTSETPLFHKANILFNYHIARKVARHEGYVYVLEGFMDVFALRRIGIDSCVALMGTALTKNHIAMLRALGAEIRLCLDGDQAGQMATMKICSLLEQNGLSYRIVDNQNSDLDPDEILKASGADALRNYLNRLLNHAQFALSYFKRNNTLNTLEERKKFVYQFIPIIAGAKDRLEQEDYLLNLQLATQFPIEELRTLLKKYQSQQKEESANQIFTSFHPEKKQLRRLQLAEREVLYQMLVGEEARDYYKNEISYFYNELYRKIANFLIDYDREHTQIDIPSLLVSLEGSEISDKEEISKEITGLLMEKEHPPYTKKLMDEYRDAIVEERGKLYRKTTLDQELQGKKPLEQAEIIAQYTKKEKE